MELKTTLFCILVALSIFTLGFFIGRNISQMEAFLQGKISEATNLLAILAHIHKIEPQNNEERETE